MIGGRRIKYLTVRYLYGNCDVSETKELFDLIAASKDYKILLQQLVDLKEIIGQFQIIVKKDKDAATFFWVCKVDEFVEKYNYNERWF